MQVRKGAYTVESQPLDQSEALLAFASEAAVAPTADREPAFLRTPTPYEGHLSITAVAEPLSPESASARPLTTVLVVAGVLAGFIGGYVFADRIIGPRPAPAVHRVAEAAPVAATEPPPAPAAAAAVVPPAPAAAPVASGESSAPRTEPATVPTREPSIPKAAQATDANVAPISSAPSTTKRASIPSSTTRRAASTRPTATRPTATRPGPAVAPTTALSGAIEIVSRPRDAQVFLDGVLVGRAPMSIPDVSEGTHEVRVQLDGFHPWVAPVRVKGGSRARLGASLEHE